MKVGKRKAKTEEVTEELDVGEELISTEKLQWKKEQLTNMCKEKQIEYENLQESLRELDHMNMDSEKWIVREKHLYWQSVVWTC